MVLCPDRTIMTIQELQGPKPKQMRTYDFIQLLRIKAGGDASTGKATQNTYSYFNKGSKIKSTPSPYHCMLLFCDLSSDTGNTFYLVEDQKSNIR